jgi:hypothetical protein
MWQGTPHFWRRIDLTDRYTSICGLSGDVMKTTNGQRIIFRPGDFLSKRCSKCSRKRGRYSVESTSGPAPEVFAARP